MGKIFIRSLWGTVGLAAIVFKIVACDISDQANEPEVVLSPNATPEQTELASELGDSIREAQPVSWSLFTLDELFDAGGGGCGMTLIPLDAERGQFLLFNGIDPNSMQMMLNEQWVTFAKENGEGEEFYGQHLKQTFSNAELNVIVETEVTLGELGEIESVDIPEGTVSIIAGDTREEIPVKGDAGC